MSDAKKYFDSALTKHNRGDYTGAISDLDKAIELDPNYAPAYYNRGVAKAELKQYSEAIADYDKAIELDPRSASAYYNRGVTKYNLKEYSEAIADYDKAIELDPNFALAYYARGLACRELGKEEEAKDEFKKAQELDPTLIFQEETKKAKKEVREEVKEEIKETAAETQKTQDFQKILEDLKETLKNSEKLWLWISIGTVVMTIVIFLLPFFEKSLPEKFNFAFPENFLGGYFLFPFLSVVSFTVLRIYTNTRKKRLETENRLAMAKLLARIDDQIKIPSESKPHYQEHFLPELAKIIVSPLYPDNKKEDVTKLSHIIKKIPLEK